MPTQTSTMVGVVQTIRFLQLFGVKPLVPHSFCRVQAAWAPITGPPPTQPQEERRASRRSPLRTFQTKLLSSGRSSVPCGGTDLKTPRRSEGAGAAGVANGSPEN